MPEETQSAPQSDLRKVFQEELTPLRNSVTALEERNAELSAQMNQLESELRATPSLQVTEREPELSKEERVLGRAFFNRDLTELKALGGGVARGGETVNRAFSQSLIATNGTLNAEQSEMFMTLTMDQAEFLRLLAYEPMNAPTKEIPKMDVQPRQMRKKTGGQKGADSDVTIPPPLLLTSVESAISTQIYFEALEDNIMRGRASRYIVDLFSVAFSNDLTDLAINGDEGSADPFVSINNGYLALMSADATVHDVAGSTFAGDVKGTLFPALRDALPHKYRRMRPALIVSQKIKDAYLDQLESRVSDLGDMVLRNGWRVPTWQGFPVIGVDYLPDDAAMFTPLQNLVFGVQRDITFGVDVYNVARYAEYGWSVRCDFGIKNGETAALCVDFAFS